MNKDIKLEKGDIITYKYSKGLEPRTTTVQGWWSGWTVKDLEYRCNYKVLKLERPQTIYEVKEILDKKEREYLSKVIEPFKNRVIHIEKNKIFYGNSEFINIVLYSSVTYDNDTYDNEENIPLPYFKKGTMYKGMELNKQYSLKELGLD